MTSPATDTELVRLVERLRPALKRILGSFGIPPHDAEDVLQEVLLAAWSRWETIESKEHWLIGTLRNRCAAYWRRRQASLLEAVDFTQLELLSEPQPAPQEREAQVWDLESLIATLSQRQRVMLWLRFGLGLKPEEVAHRLGYSPAGIRKLIGRSVNRLREAMASPDPAPRS
jgi:RNA polymerase sigma-70 factor (ECF subfamily)